MNNKTENIDVLKKLKEVVKEQAKDEKLWFNAHYITESILQRALRRLHAIIENDKIMEKIIE